MAALEKNESGLRHRQKKQRRQIILDRARTLFEADGYDATTMAAIAHAANVSPPTVFNYFGSKDELIVALVLEGHEAAREDLRSWQPDPDWALGELLGELLCFYVRATMQIAGKRVWRYAEASNIRRHQSCVSRLYDQIEDNHIGEICDHLKSHLHPQQTVTPDQRALLARLAYHRWNGMFFKFLRDDTMTEDMFQTEVRREMAGLADLVSFTAKTEKD